MMTLMPNLDEMFGPKLVYEEAGPIEEIGPLCYRCGSKPDYQLQKLILQLRTSEGGLHMVESYPPKQVRIAVCTKHKDEDLEEYIAGGCHMAIMQETNVISEMEAYTLYWRDL